MKDLWQALLEEDREMRVLGWRGCLMWYGVALPLTIPAILLGMYSGALWVAWLSVNDLYDLWRTKMEGL